MLGRLSVLRVITICSIGFIFLRIYQHNLVIKLNYDYQRLDKRKTQLEKERNELYTQLMCVNDPERVLAYATMQRNMRPLKVGQIVCLDDRKPFDFVGTTSNEVVVQQLGLFDMVLGKTGG